MRTRIISLKDKSMHEIEPFRKGENPMPCPACSSTRKNPTKKSFSWNTDKGAGYCQNCDTSFVEFKSVHKDIEYKLPIWKNLTDIHDSVVKDYERRGISQKTLKDFKIYTDYGNMGGKQNVLAKCFPYFYGEKLVNIKYKSLQKDFKLTSGAELIFWNIDKVLLFNEIVICEGEEDCLSFHEAGIENVISLPNGANFKNCSFVDNYIHLFDGKKIIIAVDNDLAGLEARNELIRRFGAESCSIISFEDKKDANEYLMAYGAVELRNAYEKRYDVPVQGIVNLEKEYDDIYSMFLHGMPKGKCIGDELDDLITWETGRLAVWSGIPGHGKSEVLDWVITMLNKAHGWKTLYFSPENYPIKYHYSKISEKLTGKKFDPTKMSMDEFTECFDYVADNFFFIIPDEASDLDSVLEKAKFMIKKKGIKQLVIDPYNRLESNMQNGVSETTYISKLLDKLTSFARKNDILIHLVAHPTKMRKDQTGLKYEIPTLYDINGSANFYNKADYGVIVYRFFGEDPKTQITIQKIKFRHLGETGIIQKRFNYINGRYEKLDKGVNDWNYDSFINKKPLQVQQQSYQDLQPDMNFEKNIQDDVVEYDKNGKFVCPF